MEATEQRLTEELKLEELGYQFCTGRCMKKPDACTLETAS